MNCCGQKRQLWQQRTLARQEPIPAHIDPLLENPVQLQYNGTSTFMFKGKKTGYLYLFAAGETPLAVDGRDVQEILSASGEISLTRK